MIDHRAVFEALCTTCKRAVGGTAKDHPGRLQALVKAAYSANDLCDACKAALPQEALSPWQRTS